MAESENLLQSKCYMWFHNTFPNYRGLLCYNLANSKNAIDGNRNKALGLQSGRSDMVFYYRGRAHMLEFKTSDGRQSPKQEAWEDLVTEHGFKYYIIRSEEQFKSIIKLIITYGQL